MPARVRNPPVNNSGVATFALLKLVELVNCAGVCAGDKGGRGAADVDRGATRRGDTPVDSGPHGLERLIDARSEMFVAQLASLAAGFVQHIAGMTQNKSLVIEQFLSIATQVTEFAAALT